MPQMAPLYWLIMLLLFITIFLMFMIKNYFSMTIISNKNINMKSSLSNKNLYWKW